MCLSRIAKDTSIDRRNYVIFHTDSLRVKLSSVIFLDYMVLIWRILGFSQYKTHLIFREKSILKMLLYSVTNFYHLNYFFNAKRNQAGSGKLNFIQQCKLIETKVIRQSMPTSSASVFRMKLLMTNSRQQSKQINLVTGCHTAYSLGTGQSRDYRLQNHKQRLS